VYNFLNVTVNIPHIHRRSERLAIYCGYGVEKYLVIELKCHDISRISKLRSLDTRVLSETWWNQKERRLLNLVLYLYTIVHAVPPYVLLTGDVPKHLQDLLDVGWLHRVHFSFLVSCLIWPDVDLVQHKFTTVNYVCRERPSVLASKPGLVNIAKIYTNIIFQGYSNVHILCPWVI
jgi:hypothetical protein